MDETTYKPRVEKYIQINWGKICTDIFPCFLICSCMLFFICFAIGNSLIFDSKNWKVKIIGLILSFPMAMFILVLFVVLLALICYGIFYSYQHVKKEWFIEKEREMQLEIL